MSAGEIIIANSEGFAYSFNITFDQLEGTDTTATLEADVEGKIADATPNIETTDNTFTAQDSGIADEDHSNTAGDTVNTAGDDGGVTATDSAGGTILMALTSTTPDGLATYSLVSGGSIQGLQDFSVDISASLSQSGGSTSFDLNDGAVFQVGANQSQQVGVAIRSMDAVELGRNAAGSGTLTSINDMLSTEQGALLNGMADEALAVIDQAIDEVTNLRGALGAFQANTLESGMNSLRISRENLSSAESVIRDVDFAQESATFTRNQIMVQSSTAMLAQANQLPQNVLQLLG
ncbi:MAG: hypothetical protein EA401_04730 [Planctomycetota bacterium]|nr:MAG: hypothetical protein EA401_04730 [Planctomycetota bacterium]